MSFVFPALLGTLVLAGIPVLLHLILRQKPKTLPFPAFRFLVVRHRSNQRKLQLRHLLLLLLRIALLAGLIVAVARPRVLQHNLGLSSERPVAAVFVFDVSPSMDYRSSDNRSRLDDAKARAVELVNVLPAGSRIEILASSDNPGVRPDWLQNTKQVTERIRDLKLNPASPPLNRALVAGLRHLGDPASKAEEQASQLPRLVCVFSDTTRGAWDPSQTTAVLEAADALLPPREAMQDAAPELAAALAALKAGTAKSGASEPLQETLGQLRDLLPRLGPADFPLKEEPAKLVQRARQGAREVLRALPAEADKESAGVADALRTVLRRLAGAQALWIDVGIDAPRDLGLVRLEWPQRGSELLEAFPPGEKFLLQSAAFAAGQDFQTSVQSKPGNVRRPVAVKSGDTALVPFDVDTAPFKPGYHSLEFHVDVNDAWTGNNFRFATFLVREPQKVLVVSEFPERAEHYFVRALDELKFQVETKTPAEAQAGIPPAFRTVYLFELSQPSEPLWRALETFVRAGGGLAIVPGGEEMKEYDSPIAGRLMPGTWKKIVGKPGDAGGVTWDWEPPEIYRHPLLAPFRAWRSENRDLFALPRRTFAFWEVEPAGKDNVLIRYSGKTGYPALLERKVGAGQVLQFTTPLDRRTPEWHNYLETVSSFYVTLLGMTTQHLVGALEPVRCNFVVSEEEPSVPIRTLSGRETVLLRGPERLEKVKVPPGASRLPFPQANLPGNYLVQDDLGKETLAAFSVNLSPQEATLVRWPRSEVENLFGAEAVVPADRQADLRQLLKGHWSEPMELYPVFMIALLLLLAIENLLANRFYRQESRAS